MRSDGALGRSLRTAAELATAAGRSLALAEIVAPIAVPELIALAERIVTMEPWRRYDSYTAEGLAGYLGNVEPHAPRFLIRENDDVVGAFGVRRGWLRGPYLQFLAVLPEGQRRGIGSAVLDWLEAEARASGERNLLVLTSAFNVPALAFYERHGFTRVGPLPDLVADGITEILLHKRLR